MVLLAYKTPTPHKIRIKKVTHLCLNKKPKVFVYLRVTLLKPLLKALKNLVKIPPFFSGFALPLFGVEPFSFFLVLLKKIAESAGLNVSALTAEIRIATISVIPNCL